MNSDGFGKWWPCLRKHYKRHNLWLPRARMLKEAIGNGRPFRYFTLCALPMIDVYMLVKENVLDYDTETKRIQGISFCECDTEFFPQMKELIGVEEAGFLGKLEDLVLFRDVPQTATLDSEDAISLFLEQSGEGLEEEIRQKAEMKRSHILFRQLFPVDFINLDFCDPYYKTPPNVMEVHETVERILEWQRQPGVTPTGANFSVARFVIAITCRVGVNTPSEALQRLTRIVQQNRASFPEYREALADRAIQDIANWATESPLDFFMSAWPKEIARIAQQKAWDIFVHDHAFYNRQNEEGEPYDMVCLIVEFVQAQLCTTYVDAVKRCLDKDTRTNIPLFDPRKGEGEILLSDLREIVALRNTQAGVRARLTLPDPLDEILRQRSQGVPI